MRKSTSLLAVLGLCIGLGFAQAQLSSGKGAPEKGFAPVAPGEHIQNLDVFKAELKEYHACTCTCGCYAKDLDLQADRAIEFLKQRVGHAGKQEKLALILDIDETSLSNWEQMERAGFAYDGKAFNAWIESAKAPVIPGTLRIVQEAKHLGVSVFFLTGRAESQRAATEQNLHTAGYDGWAQLILRQSGQQHLSAMEYKSAERAKLVAQGYRIVLNVGDQWSDLKGAPEAEYSVKYPDPFYFLK